MTKLVPCKACGREVARRAFSCPFCGRLRPAPTPKILKRILYGSVAAAGGLFILAIIGAWIADDTVSTPFQVGVVYAAKDQAAVCRDAGLLDEVENSGLNDHLVQADGCVVIGSVVQARVIGHDGVLLKVRVETPPGQNWPGLTGYEGYIKAENLKVAP